MIFNKEIGADIVSENTFEGVDYSAKEDENGWFYYSNKNDGYKLYKIRTDGTSRTKLNDDKSLGVNIISIAKEGKF